MPSLDKFLRFISKRYPDAKKINRTLVTVGRDIEKRHPQIRQGVPNAQKMFDQRSDLYGRLLEKKNNIQEDMTMNPALMALLKKYGAKMLEPKNMAIGAGAAGVGALGAYGGHKATMDALPESMLEALGLPQDMAEDVTGSIEDAYNYAEEHPLATAAILAPAGYGISRATGDLGQQIHGIGQGIMEERRRRKRK